MFTTWLALSIDVSYFFIPRFWVNNPNGRHDFLWLNGPGPVQELEAGG
jgi:hypothetical protein